MRTIAYNDYGIIQLGSFIKGDNPSPPNYMEFGIGSVGFSGSTAHLQNGVFRSPITWRWNGNKPVATTQLSTVDAVGSNLQEVGLGVGSVIGSNLHTRDLSAIGDKTNSFTVDVSAEIRYSRP